MARERVKKRSDELGPLAKACRVATVEVGFNLACHGEGVIGRILTEQVVRQRIAVCGVATRGSGLGGPVVRRHPHVVVDPVERLHRCAELGVAVLAGTARGQGKGRPIESRRGRAVLRYRYVAVGQHTVDAVYLALEPAGGVAVDTLDIVDPYPEKNSPLSSLALSWAG